MTTEPRISMVWVVAIGALTLASLGIDPGRPLVSDLDLPGQAALD